MKLDQSQKLEFFRFLLTRNHIVNNYENLYKNLKDLEAQFNYYFNDKYVQYSNSQYKICDFIKKLDFLINSDEYPNTYINYIKSREEVKNNSFTSDFINILNLQNIDFLSQNSFENIFNKRFYQLLIDYYLSLDLSNWSDIEYKKIINDFKNSCMKLNEIAKFKVIENVLNNFPFLNSIIYNNELDILKKEYSKSRNKKSIRKLLMDIPNLYKLLNLVSWCHHRL